MCDVSLQQQAMLHNMKTEATTMVDYLGTDKDRTFTNPLQSADPNVNPQDR